MAHRRDSPPLLPSQQLGALWCPPSRPPTPLFLCACAGKVLIVLQPKGAHRVPSPMTSHAKCDLGCAARLSEVFRTRRISSTAVVSLSLSFSPSHSLSLAGPTSSWHDPSEGCEREIYFTGAVKNGPLKMGFFQATSYHLVCSGDTKLI